MFYYIILKIYPLGKLPIEQNWRTMCFFIDFLIVKQANDTRDALSKTLYGKLFTWIVVCINKLLAPGKLSYAIVFCNML